MERNFSASVLLWHFCNLKCPYCFAAPTPPPGGWPAEIPERLAQLETFLNNTGKWTISLSGGEPTIYPGFGDFCVRLANAGHRVEVISNGLIPFGDVFTPQTIKAVSQIILSYHPAHEKASSCDEIFDANIAYLQENNVSSSINYVAYPGRKNPPGVVKQRFAEQGARVKFLPFQGELDGRHYPFEYNADERDALWAHGDITARYLTKHAHYVPTFKRCRAGHEKFYIWMHTAEVYTCEQLTQRPLANFTNDNAAAEFAANVSSEPIVCPAKRCVCRHTVAQEQFLAEHDRYEQANYEAWEKISLPTAKAVTHWDRLDRVFAQELQSLVTGEDVFFWGGGGHTVHLLGLLGKHGFPLAKVRGIIDSNPRKNGGTLLGFPVVSRDHFEAQDLRCSDIFISSKAFEAEIAQDIEERYGQRFNVVRLYDGTLQEKNKALGKTILI